MSSKLQCNIRGFFNETLRNQEPKSNPLPLLALDECLNKKIFIKRLGSLVEDSLAFGVERLWYQARVTREGKTLMLHGSKVPGHKVFDIGEHVPGFSYPDSEVICNLVAQFSLYDHVIFMSQDNNEKVHGITYLLCKEVEPVLNEFNFNRYGLTVILKNTATDTDSLFDSVKNILENRVYGFGYKLLRL